MIIFKEGQHVRGSCLGKQVIGKVVCNRTDTPSGIVF